MRVLARWFVVVFVLATSCVLPAFAWAQPADPCVSDSHDPAEAEELCAPACVCPCCPVRVTFEAEPMLPSARLAQRPEKRPPDTSARLRAGAKREIFHPPSC